MHQHDFSFEIYSLDIARGHDGFLRGDPEPVVLAAVYVLDGTDVRTMDKALYRFTAQSPFPSTAPPQSSLAISAQIHHQKPIWFAVLAIALERDAGGDVQRMYGALDHHEGLSLYRPEGDELAPIHVAELVDRREAWRYPQKTQLLVDGSYASAGCSDDEWVGSVAWVMSGRTPPFSTRRQTRSEFRLHFRAADERNDWTALARVQQ